MGVKYRKLNSDETYCCTKNDITTIFNKADIDINFGYMGFRDSKYNSTYKNKKHAKQGGILLLTMVLRNNYELLGIPIKSSISIYIIKKNDFNQKLEDKFKKDILPKMFDLYESYFDHSSQQEKSIQINVWLKDGDFCIE